MKKSGLFVSGLSIILFFFFHFSPVIAADKYGVYDLQQILMRCEAGKKNVEILKKMETDKIKPIEQKDAELKKIKDDLEKKKKVLTEAAFRERETDLHKKERDLQIMAKDAADEIRAKEQEMLNKLLPEIERIIRAIGEKEKYTMIIDARTQVYFDKNIDLTQKIIDELNKTYKP